MLTSGSFPVALDAQLQRAEAHLPEVREAVRRACLEVFDEKTHFALHDDPRSRHVFDVMLWLHETATGPGITRADMHEILKAWFRDARGGFGLNGYAPGFLDDWWAARFDEGALEGDVNGKGPSHQRRAPPWWPHCAHARYEADTVGDLLTPVLLAHGGINVHAEPQA
ncbi:hypothetical protein ACFSC4_09750 [Deinococcus malanensis]|uniref:hypothetical protein n=1 Tax=Deinococcus malanensis TaxID=1706855 RepID=UPI0036359DD7